MKADEGLWKAFQEHLCYSVFDRNDRSFVILIFMRGVL